MADNLSQKSPKSGEKTKLINAINRTTSETMRLGEPEKSVNHPTSLSSSTPSQRKKTPAFQITSVTVGPRISNDGGDDSADDLDESHTDDISDVIDSSRITDIENETPSYSEDTFSKEDVFFNASAAPLGTAPVIPTSSQYGLAIVATESGGNILNTAVTCANSISSGDVHVSVTESGNVINIVSSVKQNETDMRDVHTHTSRNERFKVVKIESTEPFKRGRWMCMDYLDHTMQQQHQSQQAIIVKAAETTETGSLHYVGADSGVVITDGLGMHHGMDDHCGDQSQLNTPAVSLQDQHHQSLAAAQQQHIMANLAAAQGTSSNYTSISPGQTLQQVPMGINQQQASIGAHQLLQQGMIPDQSISQSMAQNIQVANQQQATQQPQGQSQNMTAAQVLQQQHHAQSLSHPIQQQQQVTQHQSLPPQQIQQAMAAAANMQQMQQQNIAIGQHQGLSQQIPHQQQGYVPQSNQQFDQQNMAQQGMMTAQQGMPPPHHVVQQQPQPYYTTTSVGPVPVSQQAMVAMSQGQGGQTNIQLIPQSQTSISAQTQTNHTSTNVQKMPSQSQPITSIPMQVSAHSIPVNVASSTGGMPMPGSVTQVSQPQQMPTQPQLITSQKLTPQQQQQIQQQMMAQHQMPQQQQMPLQQQMQSQQQMPQQIQPQQQMQQQMQPQQQMTQQIPQQMPSQQQIPQQQIPVQQHIPVQQQMQSQQQMQQQAMQQQIHMQNMQTPQVIPQQIITAPMNITTSVHPQQVTAANVIGAPVGITSVNTVVGSVKVGSSVSNVIDPNSGNIVGTVNNPMEIQQPDVTNIFLETEAATVVEDIPAVPAPGTGDDAESASGTSAVAIDNKIEQAMDLVKSHLMFAVREEVEVLKEKIAELMDRINQLELENTILKAHASQETLAQLGGSGNPQQSNKNQQTQPPPNGSVS